MNEFLRYLEEPEARATYRYLDETWDARAGRLNALLEDEDLPVRVANMTSVFTTLYSEPSRYNWMLQYYLRAEGLALSWIGTGRIIFSHNLTDLDFGEIAARFVRAARAMRDDGWWPEVHALSNASIKRRVLREMLSAAALRAAAPSVLRGRAPSGRAIRP